MTPSEIMLDKLCNHSFLSMWSYANPIRSDDGKELCDLLVVNSPWIIIFSIKEVHVASGKDPIVDMEKWVRKAVYASVKQIYGAERALNQGVKVVSSDRKHQIFIPDIAKCIFARIAVAIGRGDRFPLLYGNLGKGFVHTFDEVSLPIMLGELDTISDFTKYLTDKENFFAQGKRLVCDSEENMLALYLGSNRKFIDTGDYILVDPESWNQYLSKDEVLRKKRDDKESYIWDSILEEFYRDHREGVLYRNAAFHEIEYALRIMSKEDRFSRRVLSSELLDFVGFYSKPKVRSRLLSSPSGITYVYLLAPHDESNREERIRELTLRCIVARSLKRHQPIVVGIATNQYVKGSGHSYDLFYMENKDWTPEMEESANKIRDELGYFRDSLIKPASYDEYPTS